MIRVIKQKECKEILSTKVADPFNFLANYFYGTGEYTIKGSPYDDLDNDYELNNWLKLISSSKADDIEGIIVLGLEFKKIVVNKKAHTSGAVDNLLSGRSDFIQSVVDGVIDQYLRKVINKELNIEG